MVDWDLAVTTGTRLVRPGPQTTAAEARQVVTDLKSYAAQANGHVAGFTGLHAPTDGSSVVVIDRPGWIQANAAGFRTVLEPLVDKLQDRRKVSSPVGDAVGAKVTGVQTGSLLAFLATKVLGQYELFPPYGQDPGSRPGRLLLVAPNIVAAEQEMGVDPHDFRLWVCLHEETHRVQFGAVPWLREHMMSEISNFVEATDVDPDRLRSLLGDSLGEIVRVLRGDSESSLVEIVTNPEQREVIDSVTAVMSLLEGHADVVMDGVGPEVIPTVDTIRERFNRRRKGSSGLDQMLRRLLGLDIKMKQYAEGAVFVRGVVDAVGMTGFNAVWSSPEALPTRQEILAPATWVSRVHG